MRFRRGSVEGGGSQARPRPSPPCWSLLVHADRVRGGGARDADLRARCRPRCRSRRPGVESSATHVLDADGNEIGIYKQFDTNIPVNQGDIPQVLKDAVVSAEDKHFYDHGGVDVGSDGPSAHRRLAQRRGRAGRLDDHAAVREERVHERRTHASDASCKRRSSPASSIASSTRTRSCIATCRRSTSGAAPTASAQPRRRTSASRSASSGLSEAALLAGVIPSPSKYSPLVDPVLAEQRAPLGARSRCSSRDASPRPRTIWRSQVPIWLAVNGPPPGPATVVYPPEQQTVHATVVHGLRPLVARDASARLPVRTHARCSTRAACAS